MDKNKIKIKMIEYTIIFIIIFIIFIIFEILLNNIDINIIVNKTVSPNISNIDLNLTDYNNSIDKKIIINRLYHIKNELNQLGNDFEINKDSVENYTIIKPKYLNNDSNFLYCYLCISNNSILRNYYIGFNNPQWLFVNEIVFNIDGEIQTILFPYENRKSEIIKDPFAIKILEYIEFTNNSELDNIFKKIADSKVTWVKFKGKDGNKSFIVNQKQKNAIKQIYDYEKLYIKLKALEQ